MKKKKSPLAPFIPELIELDYLTIGDEEIIEGVSVKNQDLSYQEVENLFLRESVFNHLVMTRNRLVRFECSNVRFEHCDFSNTEWIGASFHQVVFHQCKLTGTNFAESYLKDCVFEDCLGDYASFSSADLKTVHFEKTSLVDTEFFELKWKDLTIEHCNLTGGNWMRTPLRGLDFTRNRFDKLLFSQDLLNGLTVTPEQGLLIVGSLGLIIE